MIPMFPNDETCPVCCKACLDKFGEHALHCRELPGFKYRHDFVRDALMDILRRAGSRRRKRHQLIFYRPVLDFDFEKFCSVSLSNLNVYACLVCGKYFQGRGHKSHAYTHSLEAGHHVYINLKYIASLMVHLMIFHIFLPKVCSLYTFTFNKDQVLQLDRNRQWSRALDGSDYLPGMVGLNNIKETDFVNVHHSVFNASDPLRIFFSFLKITPTVNLSLFTVLVSSQGRYGMQGISKDSYEASKKRFRIGAQSDPVEFMSWLLNTLHTDLKSSRTKTSSIIHQCFQGELEVVKEINAKDGAETSRMPFLMLGLDLPPPPLFKDVMEKNIIPQVPLFNILKKFDGESVTEVVRPRVARMRYRVTRLPQYLILHMRRFTKNNFFVEKNPTLVNFPVKNLELKDYIPLLPSKEGEEERVAFQV
ncbi:putative ubiquitinyl hydrolase 1 [Helianthus annuus]|nr:putative ubiquitinyl hydrolase 1 [Helianthus annuus]